MTSASQAEMFARVRRATDDLNDAHGLRDGWTQSIHQVTRTVQEQAPIHGLCGMSEGATVASVLLVQTALGQMKFGAGLEALTSLSICALTSPAHAELYREVGTTSTSASLHLVGDADTADIQHMVGRTAALFGSTSGMSYFAGGHKLPKIDGLLAHALR